VLARTTPVTPPIVNKKRKPKTQHIIAFIYIFTPYSVAIHLKIFTPVGTAMAIVALVKYARVSKSIPTVNM